MSRAELYPTDAAPAVPCNLTDLERRALRSPAVARAVTVGLPALGLAASLIAGLPLFAAFMMASFLLATTLVCRTALVTFTGATLRLLVASRLVVVLVLGALLACASGGAWAAVVGAVLLWLCADRLLGRVW